MRLGLALDAGVLGNLPIFYALDRRYFESAGLDIDVRAYTGESALRALLSDGGVVLASVAPTPRFFELAENPGLRVISMLDTPLRGRAQSAWLTVPKEKTGQIQELRDLRNRVVDGGSEDAITNVLVLEAIQIAELRQGVDVVVQNRARTEADVRAAIAGGTDVIAVAEPLATKLEKQGVVTRWKSLDTLAPWYRGALVGTTDFATKSSAAVSKFLDVYRATARALDQTRGAWAADLSTTAARWTGVEPDLVMAQGGVPSYGDVDPNKAAVVRSQDIWTKQGLVTKRIDVDKVFAPVTKSTEPSRLQPKGVESGGGDEVTPLIGWLLGLAVGTAGLIFFVISAYRDYRVLRGVQ